MQPPSEADIVAATQSLEVRRDLKLAQIETLQTIQACLEHYRFSGSGSIGGGGALEHGVSGYLGHLITEHRLDAEVLEAQIVYNRRVLSAVRSNILLPSFGPRKPSN